MSFVYGLAIFAIGNAFGPGILSTFGGSLVLDGHLGEDDPFYVVIGLFDVDFGLRALASSSFGAIALFHLPLRLGIGIDVSAFTAELVGGPAFLAGNGTLGAFEGLIEVGVRW